MGRFLDWPLSKLSHSYPKSSCYLDNFVNRRTDQAGRLSICRWHIGVGEKASVHLGLLDF